jgi:hypothetical protein
LEDKNQQNKKMNWINVIGNKIAIQ